MTYSKKRHITAQRDKKYFLRTFLVDTIGTFSYCSLINNEGKEMNKYIHKDVYPFAVVVLILAILMVIH